MTNKEIGERIKDTRKSMGKTLEDIASEIGVAKSTIQRYEAGRIDKIKLPVISAIADVLGVNDAWLIGKSDKKHLTDADRFWSFAQAYNATHFPSSIKPATVTTYDLLGEVACGEPIIADRKYEVYSNGDRVNANAVVVAKGDSMIGARIYDGDIVFIRYQETVENGEVAAVLVESLETHDWEIVLKRFYRYDNVVILHSENPSYKDIELRGEDRRRFRILGKAVAFQSDIR